MVGSELLVEQPRRSARLDVVAERLEQPGRLGDRCDAVGGDRHTDRRDRFDVADAQAVGSSDIVVA